MAKKYIEREAAIMTAMNYDGSGTAQDFSQDIASAIGCIPIFDVAPVAEINDAVDEAIRILNAIRTRGDMDYSDYCELHDAISAIYPDCGADMQEKQNDT